jgi:hypothetical protein
MSTDRLFFEIQAGEVSSSTLTVYNRSSTAIYFEWVKEEKASRLPVRITFITDGLDSRHHECVQFIPAVSQERRLVARTCIQLSNHLHDSTSRRILYF